jgi:hypothetical protein
LNIAFGPAFPFRVSHLYPSCKAGRGTSERFFDRNRDAFDIAEHVIVPEADYAVASRFQ